MADAAIGEWVEGKTVEGEAYWHCPLGREPEVRVRVRATFAGYRCSLDVGQVQGVATVLAPRMHKDAALAIVQAQVDALSWAGRILGGVLEATLKARNSTSELLVRLRDG